MKNVKKMQLFIKNLMKKKSNIQMIFCKNFPRILFDFLFILNNIFKTYIKQKRKKIK